jgi:hypothetical protein
MAKATRYGGASLTAEESADPESPQPVKIRRAELGYVDQPNKVEEESTSQEVDGGDSIQSSESGQTSSESTTPARQRRARSTASHSSQSVMDSTAHSTGTATPNKLAKQSGSARVSSTDAEFSDFE